MNVTVRAVRDADIPIIVQLWQRVFGYTQARNDPAAVIAEHARYGAGLLLVAEDGGDIVGTVMAGYDGHRGWMHRACVEARVRRFGIATQLVRAAESHLQQLGCRKINLQIHSDNASALAFWRRLGYLEEPRVSMGKDLGVTNAPGNRRASGTLNLQFPRSDEGAT